MKEKHLQARIKQCLTLAECSPCPRHKFGTIILEPERNVILVDGYNGTPRSSKNKLCGGDVCLRDVLQIPTGTRPEIGCDHSEANAICNAAHSGTAIGKGILLVNGEPCLACAKLIHQCGITKVIIITNGYTTNAGIEHLLANGVMVETVEPI